MTMREFCSQLARMRHVDRNDLPKSELWDEDWPRFRDNPFWYFLVCSDEHQKDIWDAIERDRVRTPAERIRRLRSAIQSVLE